MYRILVCDDERDIVNALKIYLEAEGHEVVTAHTGAEALAALEREEVHLVLLDIMMPEIDGITAMTRIREKSNVPVILLTAKSEDTDKVLGLNLGAGGAAGPGPFPASAVYAAGRRRAAALNPHHRRRVAGRYQQGRHSGRGAGEPDTPGV